MRPTVYLWWSCRGHSLVAQSATVTACLDDAAVLAAMGADRILVIARFGHGEAGDWRWVRPEGWRRPELSSEMTCVGQEDEP